jgi:peptidoglycan glycosyltransferase
VDRQIRRVGVGLLVLISALFLQLNYLQVVRADKLANDPGNARKATRDFNRERGVIQTADGALLAHSVPTPNADFKRIRRYPEGALFGHVTGF